MTGVQTCALPIWGLTRCLALEGGPLDIHVNAIAPIAYTALSRSSRVAPESWRSGTGDAWSARLAVEQVSPAMAWLAHADCSINGQVWTVAGGRVGRFVLGVTEGFDDDALTIEQVRDREDEIVDAGTTFEYGSGGEEGKALHRRLVRRDRT